LRIAFVHSTDFPARLASVVQVVQMCRAFSALGHQVTLFSPRLPECASEAAALAAAHEIFGSGPPFEVEFVPRVRVAGRLEVLGTVKGTLAALRKHSLDLIYSRNPWTVAFLSRLGVPYVFEAHEEYAHKRSRVLDILLRRMIVRHSRHPSCALVVTISEALRGIWQGYGLPEAKLLAAHDGVDLSLFDRSLTQTEARARLATMPGAPRLTDVRGADRRLLVVYAGMIRPECGLDLVLAAAREFRHMDFVLVGGSPEEVAPWRAETVKRALSNVFFAGRVPHREVPLWLAAADILLAMWTWRVRHIRGFSPLKLFEYMAAERLIVCPAFPTVREVVEDGREAILFEPERLDGLLTALGQAQAAMEDPRMPRAAREKVERDYTWQARCRRILDAVAARTGGPMA
jgi:glycosyltransferase involved in cell wall biosynthesis